MTEAVVTPTVITWARHRRGLESSEVAARLNVRSESIDAWEVGDRRPTFRQARRLANVLHVPFGYLFLSAPPVFELPIPDYRTLPGQASLEPSPELLDLLNDVIAKQQWFREYRESEGAQELPFVARFSTTDSEEAVADDIRRVIDVDRARSQAANWESFLRALTRNAEQTGVMIMRSGVVGNNNNRTLDVKEFRGFTISDQVVPLVFINAHDSRGAQIFTLAHEMAHIWTGQGGVSNPDYSSASRYQENAIERFCNRVAAETLVPGEDFRSRWRHSSLALENNLAPLARHYKVSNMVILRQAYDHDFISAESYWNGYRNHVEQFGGIEAVGDSGGNFHYTLTARNGLEFTQAVISSVASGTLLRREAAQLLNVRIQTLPGIAEHLFGDAVSLA